MPRLTASFAIAVSLASGCCSDQVLQSAQRRARAVRSIHHDDFAPEVPAAAHCADAPLVRGEALLEDGYEGKRVAIDGRPAYTELSCTDMRCTDPCGRDLPCCNRCWAGAIVLTLPGSAPQVILEHPEISCGGHDCHMLCVPFGVAPKRDYRFVGTVIRRGTTFAIEVDRWCSTD